MEKKKTTFNLNIDKEKTEMVTRKFKFIKQLVVDYTIAQVQDPRTFIVAGGVGLYQGLKDKGSIKRGIKAGVATVGVMVGITVINGLIEDIDLIKKS